VRLWWKVEGEPDPVEEEEAERSVTNRGIMATDDD
jgi:hypothetical protein